VAASSQTFTTVFTVRVTNDWHVLSEVHTFTKYLFPKQSTMQPSRSKTLNLYLGVFH